MKMCSSVRQILLEPSSTIFLLIMFSTPFLLAKWLFEHGTKILNPPPSPPKLPIIGHLHLLGSYPHRSLRSLARRYGPIMALRRGNKQALVVTSANAAREILKTHDALLADRPEVKIARKLLYDLKDISAAPYGEYWRQLKSVCTLHVLGNSRVQSFRGVREEETMLLVNEIRDHCDRRLVVNLSEMFSSIGCDVVCRAAFGRKYNVGEEGKKFRQLLKDFVGLLVVNVEDFIPWLGWILNRVNGKNVRWREFSKPLMSSWRE